jgi:hypothetical protein
MPPPFSHGARCRGHVWTSAQRSQFQDGSLQHPHDLVAQTAVVMVKQNCFYQGQADPETIVSNQRYRSSFYNEPAGASTGVPVPFLPLADLLVSVETIAMTRG